MDEDYLPHDVAEEGIGEMTVVQVDDFAGSFRTWRRMQVAINSRAVKEQKVVALIMNDDKVKAFKTAPIKKNADYDDTTNYVNVGQVSMPFVQSIEKGAFFECHNLQSIIAEKLVKVEEFAFCACTMLKEVSIPSVRVVEDSAFRDCASLETVKINSTTEAERYAFFGCSRLEQLAVGLGFACNVDYVDPDGIHDPTQGILRYLKFKHANFQVKEMKYTSSCFCSRGWERRKVERRESRAQTR
mmetsp:Transcript_9590/g.19514  ORF Transcript_9590/g.19514 Transcript_9590/m.19514 type:complete len:243 (+) Transcript_9590:169-897(+)